MQLSLTELKKLGYRVQLTKIRWTLYFGHNLIARGGLTHMRKHSARNKRRELRLTEQRKIAEIAAVDFVARKMKMKKP